MAGAIVFDLDGTLVDSAPDLHAAANRMLADFGHAPLSLQQVISFIGNGIPTLVERAMHARAIPKTECAAMQKAMLAHYTAHPADLTRPYPGVIETLQTLVGAGHRLAICTNKFHAPSLQILQALQLAEFFDVVIGGDSLRVRKPDPAPLHHAFSALAAPALLYVGDSEVDAQTASRAGVAFGLFTCGYRKSPVQDLDHSFAFDHFADLPAQVRALTAP